MTLFAYHIAKYSSVRLYVDYTNLRITCYRLLRSAVFFDEFSCFPFFNEYQPKKHHWMGNSSMNFKENRGIFKRTQTKRQKAVDLIDTLQFFNRRSDLALNRTFLPKTKKLLLTYFWTSANKHTLYSMLMKSMIENTDFRQQNCFTSAK